MKNTRATAVSALASVGILIAGWQVGTANGARENLAGSATGDGQTSGGTVPTLPDEPSTSSSASPTASPTASASPSASPRASGAATSTSAAPTSGKSTSGRPSRQNPTTSAPVDTDEPTQTQAPQPTRAPIRTQPATRPTPVFSQPPAEPERTGLKDGTYTGSGTHRFGTITVVARISGGAFSAVNAGSTSTDGRSTSINDGAFPVLRQQLLRGQSANIDGVSGATLTSDAYRSSLQQIVDQASR